MRCSMGFGKHYAVTEIRSKEVKDTNSHEEKDIAFFIDNDYFSHARSILGCNN